MQQLPDGRPSFINKNQTSTPINESHFDGRAGPPVGLDVLPVSNVPVPGTGLSVPHQPVGVSDGGFLLQQPPCDGPAVGSDQMNSYQHYQPHQQQPHQRSPRARD
eukprot:Selendium_serpulae@DN5308_c0_g2_i1.p2